MQAHELWHIFVLAAALFGAAALAILVLVPLAFEEPPPGPAGLRPLLIGLVALGVILLFLEWVVVH